MSTRFGVYLDQSEEIELVDDMLPEIHDDEYYIEVAVRHNGGSFSWRNPLAPLLPDDIKVYPLSNSAQGIFTIGDIKKEINETRTQLF